MNSEEVEAHKLRSVVYLLLGLAVVLAVTVVALVKL